MMILAARDCSTTVALTNAPATNGVPVAISAPSPTINTSRISIVSPGSRASFSTVIRSFSATLYCFPPVRITGTLSLPICSAAPRANWRVDRPILVISPAGKARHYIGATSNVNVRGAYSALPPSPVHQDHLGLLKRRDPDFRFVADGRAVARVEAEPIDLDRSLRRYQIGVPPGCEPVGDRAAGLNGRGHDPRIGADRKRLPIFGETARQRHET